MLARRVLLALPLAAPRIAGAAAAALRVPVPRVTLLRVGVPGGEAARDRRARHEPYRALLRDRLGLPVELVLFPDYAGLVDAFAAGAVDLATLPPAALAAAPDARALLLPRGAGRRAVLYARPDAGIGGPADLRGRAVAWADPLSTSGHLLPAAALAALGIDPARDVRAVFAGGHEQAIHAVLRGHAAAGASWVPASGGGGPLHAAVAKGLMRAGELRVAWRSQPFRAGPLAVRCGLPVPLLRDLADLHLALPRERPALHRALRLGEAGGWVRAREAA